MYSYFLTFVFLPYESQKLIHLDIHWLHNNHKASINLNDRFVYQISIFFKQRSSTIYYAHLFLCSSLIMSSELTSKAFQLFRLALFCINIILLKYPILAAIKLEYITIILTISLINFIPVD